MIFESGIDKKVALSSSKYSEIQDHDWEHLCFPTAATLYKRNGSGTFKARLSSFKVQGA
jgi:hypothetical protein